MRRYRSLFPWRKYMAQCGHETKLKGKITAYGQSSKMKMNFDTNNIPYCLDCIEKMTIKCPWCGGPIFVGEYVTLYSPNDPNFQVPDGCVIYSQEPLILVGCQSRSCADSGADYCGIWTPPGVVERFESALEKSLRTRGPVVMNN